MRWLILLLPISLSALVQVTGDFLVLKPTATFESIPSATEVNSIRPDYRPGGRVRLSFLPEMGCSEVWAAGLYVQNRGRDRLPDIEDLTSLRGQLYTRYWYGEGFGSYTLLTSDWAKIELLGGGRYVGIEETRSVRADPNFLGIDQSRFSGGGPGVGVCSKLCLGPIGLKMAGVGFAIIGERKTDGTVHFPSTVVTIPAIDLRLALSYECGPLGAQVGYMLDYYFDVSDVPIPFILAGRRLRDSGFGGPYFSGRIAF